MSLLARVGDFTPGAIIASQPFDDEFNQLVNALSGISSNKSIRVISNDDLFAVARFDQRGNNDIIEGFFNGAEVFRVEKDGDIVGLGLTGAAGVYTFTEIPILPASNPSSANQAARKQYVDDTTVALSCTIGTESDPSSSSTVTESGRFSYFVPEGNNMLITKIKVKYQEGSHTSGGSVSFVIRVRDSSGATKVDLGPVTLNDTNNTIHVPYTVAIGGGGQSIVSGDTVTYYISARSGTVSERSVSVGFIGTQKRI
jgi:hypothetical protein